MLRFLGGLLLLVAIGAASGPAQAQYPTRTVRIIVPSPPGGITDILARVIAQSLSQSWGQPVIVDNRAGADEMIAGEAVAKSQADGHTLLVASNTAITAAPHLHKDMRYDPLKDLTPILMLGQVTPVMNVPASSPAKTVTELIALAKAQPDALNYGSFGNGTYAHVAMEDFKLRTGTQIVHIPYKGSAPAITALLRSEIAVLIVNMSNVAPHVSAGTVRIIAAAGPRRSAMRPDLPTVAESGVPGFSTGGWWGVFGPANLPAPVLDKIRSDVGRTLTTPETRKLYETNTLELIEKTPEEFAQFIRADHDNWARQIKAAGIKPD
jgi:tripartite-type tricarboxylate transporter receptor subunit TctC